MVIPDIFKGAMFKANNEEWVVTDIVIARNRLTGKWESYIRACAANDFGKCGVETHEISLDQARQFFDKQG